MRPQKAYNIADNLLWNRFIEQKELATLSLKEIQDVLSKNKEAFKTLYKKSMISERKSARKNLSFTIDNRSGYETYGYEDLESIKGNLEYISDRFNCAFRLRWILDLIEYKN